MEVPDVYEIREYRCEFCAVKKLGSRIQCGDDRREEMLRDTSETRKAAKVHGTHRMYELESLDVRPLRLMELVDDPPPLALPLFVDDHRLDLTPPVYSPSGLSRRWSVPRVLQTGPRGGRSQRGRFWGLWDRVEGRCADHRHPVVQIGCRRQRYSPEGEVGGRQHRLVGEMRGRRVAGGKVDHDGRQRSGVCRRRRQTEKVGFQPGPQEYRNTHR